MATQTPIALEPELERQAQRRARQLGIPLADYIRRLIKQDLDTSSLAATASVEPSMIFNLGDSGKTDVARDKDQLLGAALEAEHRRADS